MLKNRIDQLQREIRDYQDVPAKIRDLAELTESRTNRQLRKTLIFRNIEEVKADETYSETKELLARTISSNTSITYQRALDNIDRAHREAKRDRGGTRQGKRLIYAAFHSWELCQLIIEQFRLRCIREVHFVISADQMYGPLTSRRRNLAFQRRKELKEEGVITGGFVDFPARLMVNIPGNIVNDKKVYKLHTDFSDHQV